MGCGASSAGNEQGKAANVADSKADGYLVFISHYKGESGGDARLIKLLMKQQLEGDGRAADAERIFLDSDDLEDLRAIIANVKRAQALVVLQTANVYTRPWCLLELYTALKNQIPVIAVNINGRGYDFAMASEFLRQLETRLDEANPGARLALERELKAEGSTITDVAWLVSSCIPNILSKTFSPNAPEKLQKTEVELVLEAVDKARHVEPTLTKGEFVAMLQAAGEEPCTPAFHGRQVSTGSFGGGPLPFGGPLAMGQERVSDFVPTRTRRFSNGMVTEVVLSAAMGAEDAAKLGPDLLRAAAENDVPQVKSLLEQGADACWYSATKESPLGVSAAGGHEAACLALIRSVGGIDLETPDSLERTPLYLAVQHRHEGVAKLLLARGANVHAVQQDGTTALSLAAWNGDVGLVRLLLGRGAWRSMEAQDHDGNTPLMYAKRKRMDQVVHLLQTAGASDDLVQAAASDDMERVLELLDAAKTPVNAVDQRGNTALCRAAEEGNLRMVQLMLERGADPDARNARGRTALHNAAFYNHLDVARTLLQAGAAVDVYNHAGRTSLFWGVKEGHIEMTQLLLSHGATVSRERYDEDGKTIFDYAHQVPDASVREAILALLEDAAPAA